MIRLTRIMVYPIKSLDGVEVESVRVLPSGALEHDRRWALFDPQGGVVNGKRWPGVHSVRAEHDLAAGAVRLTAPGVEPASFRLESEAPAAGEWLSTALGTGVELRRDPLRGFPDDTDAPGPTLVGEGSLRGVAGWFTGLSGEDIHRRLRANLLLDAQTAFWEDRLVGAPSFGVGEVRFVGTGVCQRCAVPTRDPVSGAPTLGFQRTFATRRQESPPSESPRAAFDHFYRLAVNTRPLTPGGGVLRRGDVVSIQSSHDQP